jgi:hypothetical protein
MVSSSAKAAPALFRPVAAFVGRTIPERSRARKPLRFPVSLLAMIFSENRIPLFGIMVKDAAWPYPACRVVVIVGTTVLRGLFLCRSGRLARP